jgi:hypothetical protein
VTATLPQSLLWQTSLESITVEDGICFHQFEDGLCSRCDYLWCQCCVFSVASGLCSSYFKVGFLIIFHYNRNKKIRCSPEQVKCGHCLRIGARDHPDQNTSIFPQRLIRLLSNWRGLTSMEFYYLGYFVDHLLSFEEPCFIKFQCYGVWREMKMVVPQLWDTLCSDLSPITPGGFFRSL